MPIRILLALALAANAFDAFATPQHQNMTDMWFNPAESGWGLNLIHQGDTLFATLFVYGPDGQPRWYVASSLVGGDDGPLHDRPAIYTGIALQFGFSRVEDITQEAHAQVLEFLDRQVAAFRHLLLQKGHTPASDSDPESGAE